MVLHSGLSEPNQAGKAILNGGFRIRRKLDKMGHGATLGDADMDMDMALHTAYGIV
jgi:hypothetical protein